MTNTENIPFCVRLLKHTYRGTIMAANPDCYNSFQIKLSDGEVFTINSSFDTELCRYSWNTNEGQRHVLALALGKIIERYFAGKRRGNFGLNTSYTDFTLNV